MMIYGYLRRVTAAIVTLFVATIASPPAASVLTTRRPSVDHTPETATTSRSSSRVL